MRSKTVNSEVKPLPFQTLACWVLLSVLLPLLGAFPARAQSAKLNLSALQKLAARAKETTDVTLDHQTLQLALPFMAKHGEDAQARQLIQQLKGIYVKDFEFAKPGEYSQADLDAILTQLHAAPWQRIVFSHDVKSQETDAVYIMGSGNSIRGLAVISAAPKELTVVNIVGPMDLNTLSHLEGHFGIPRTK